MHARAGGYGAILWLGEIEAMTRVLFAVRKGEPDWAEVLVTEVAERIPAARAWAEANGFDRLREVEIDDNTPPDFTKTVR
jgi:hypothetical protein